METGETVFPTNCYQCGGTEFALTEEGAESGWIVCDRCGERAISADELRALIAHNEERTVRDKLGVDEFLRARRIDDQVAKGK